MLLKGILSFFYLPDYYHFFPFFFFKKIQNIDTIVGNFINIFAIIFENKNWAIYYSDSCSQLNPLCILSFKCNTYYLSGLFCVEGGWGWRHTGRRWEWEVLTLYCLFPPLYSSKTSCSQLNLHQFYLLRK